MNDVKEFPVSSHARMGKTSDHTAIALQSFTPFTGPADSAILPRFPDELDADNEFNWQQLSDQDKAYLSGPRATMQACPWCGGRTRHNPLCDELRASWEFSMPFGRHKSKPLSAIPRDYLLWLKGSSEISSELMQAIKEHLEATA